VGWPARSEYNHLILAQETRLLLEQELTADGGRVVCWRSERLLRHLYTPFMAPDSDPPGYEIPDAQIEWQTTPGAAVETADIEVDGAYYGRMLVQKAAHYGATQRPVLWACTPKRAALVEQAIAPYTNIRLFVLHTLS
jgi:hypothetical protein